MLEQNLNNSQFLKINTIDNKNIVKAFHESKDLNDFIQFFECFDDLDINIKFELNNRFGHCLGHILSYCLERNISIDKNLDLKIKIINYLLNFNFDLNCIVDENNFKDVSVFSALIQFILLTQETNNEDELIDIQEKLKQLAVNIKFKDIDFLDYQVLLVKNNFLYPEAFISTNYHMFIYGNTLFNAGIDINENILKYMNENINDMFFQVDILKNEAVDKNYSIYFNNKKRLMRETIFISKVFENKIVDEFYENKKVTSKHYARRSFFENILLPRNDKLICLYLNFWEKAIKVEDLIDFKINFKKNTFQIKKRQNITGIILNTLECLLERKNLFSVDVYIKSKELLILLIKNKNISQEQSKNFLKTIEYNILNSSLSDNKNIDNKKLL